MAMIAITTNSSINVNARRARERMTHSSFQGCEGTTEERTPARVGGKTESGDREVERVRTPRSHCDLLLRVHIPVFGDQFLGDDVGTPARAGRVVRVEWVDRGLTVPGRHPNQVLARLQPVLPGDAVRPAGDDRVDSGALVLERGKLDQRAVLDRLTL